MLLIDLTGENKLTFNVHQVVIFKMNAGQSYALLDKAIGAYVSHYLNATIWMSNESNFRAGQTEQSYILINDSVKCMV